MVLHESWSVSTHGHARISEVIGFWRGVVKGTMEGVVRWGARRKLGGCGNKIAERGLKLAYSSHYHWIERVAVPTG
jgi:hypothetical protein